MDEEMGGNSVRSDFSLCIRNFHVDISYISELEAENLFG